MTAEHSIYDFSLTSLTGTPVALTDFANHVILLVNTASECLFTPQYNELQALHQRYREQGLVIIGCPCNQFGKQEPGNASAIGAFCQKNYGVDFIVTEKLDVNGANAHPLWRYLQQQKPGFLGSKQIKWNFTKFLVDKQGRVYKRFAPQTKPHTLEQTIKTLLTN